MTAGPHRAPPADLDRLVGRLLTLGTYASIILLAIGSILMFAGRIDPLGGAPPFEAGLIVDDITHLRPAGFMWLGLLTLLATPILRVVVSFFGFTARGERTMAVVAVLILTVIAASVVLGSVEA
jgi:uncharacterized membrane protein